ncbi:hypothetical protein DSECCO2_541340 [anaerobic digester metagenome]
MQSRSDRISMRLPCPISAPALHFHSIDKERQMIIEIIGFCLAGYALVETDGVVLKDVYHQIERGALIVVDIAGFGAVRTVVKGLAGDGPLAVAAELPIVVSKAGFKVFTDGIGPQTGLDAGQHLLS